MTDCLSTFQLDKLMLKAVDEMEPTEKAELQEAEQIAREFLAWEEELGGSDAENEVEGGDGKEGEAEELRKQVRALLEGMERQ